MQDRPDTSLTPPPHVSETILTIDNVVLGGCWVGEDIRLNIKTSLYYWISYERSFRYLHHREF